MQGIGGGAATVVLPGSQAVCAVVGEGVGLGGLSVLGPGPGGDIAGVSCGGAGLDWGVVPQGHGEDVGGAAACSLFGRPGGEPTLDVEGVGGGDGIGARSGGCGLQTAEGVVGVGHGGGDAAVDAGAFGEQASAEIVGEGAGLVVGPVLLAGGGDGSEEVKSGGVAGDRAHGVGLDGLDKTPELVVVEGAFHIGRRDARAGKDGDLLVGLEAYDNEIFVGASLDLAPTKKRIHITIDINRVFFT